MQFTLDASDLAFRQAAREWLRANVPAQPAPRDGRAARDYALGWLRTLHRGGWSGISWPAQYAGLGLAPERQMLWYEEYVRSGAPSVLDPTFVALHHAGPTLIACGSPAQKAAHLPRILAGEVVWCQGFSEPDSGSDLASLRTFGQVDGDCLVVNGQKIWTSYADIADYQELLIRTAPGSQRHAGLSWVICDMRAPGVTVRPIANMAGSVHFAQVFYDNVRIPLDNVVGDLHRGWQVAMTTLGFERKTAAVALQLELTQKLLRLGRLIAAMAPGEGGAGLRQDLATLRAEAMALRALSYRVAFREPASAFDGSIVRVYFSELAQRIHALAMRVLGPANLLCEVQDDWTYGYLESFSETIAGGTSEVQRNIIGERLLGLPRS